ncbi:MAG: hypothetical protein FWH29_05245 [Methanobrevibacter sp.]|nr:hypothetical protein [Methanobrevibacter sp.]
MTSEESTGINDYQDRFVFPDGNSTFHYYLDSPNDNAINIPKAEADYMLVRKRDKDGKIISEEIKENPYKLTEKELKFVDADSLNTLDKILAVLYKDRIIKKLVGDPIFEYLDPPYIIL